MVYFVFNVNISKYIYGNYFKILDNREVFNRYVLFVYSFCDRWTPNYDLSYHRRLETSIEFLLPQYTYRKHMYTIICTLALQ